MRIYMLKGYIRDITSQSFFATVLKHRLYFFNFVLKCVAFELVFWLMKSFLSDSGRIADWLEMEFLGSDLV